MKYSIFLLLITASNQTHAMEANYDSYVDKHAGHISKQEDTKAVVYTTLLKSNPQSPAYGAAARIKPLIK